MLDFRFQFSQILTGDELTRDRCFKFLAIKLKQLGKEIITDEIEAFIIEELKKILQVNRFVHTFLENVLVKYWGFDN